MIEINNAGFKYFQFESFQKLPLKHAIFSRIGGVSKSHYQSLNIGGNLGDLDENIIANKRLMFQVLDIPFETQFDVWQVHGVDIAIPEKPRKPLEPYIQADGIVSDSPEYTMVMRYADCVPILLYDPIKHIAGIVHAGWQGTVKNTVSFAIHEMKEKFAVKKADIIAGIGPSIGPDHYIVGENVINAVKSRFTTNWQKMIEFNNKEYKLNLWEANKQNLIESGVEKIEVAKMCTACNTDIWFSHRQEHGKTGRFAALIQLL
jgi:YfiH family protein